MKSRIITRIALFAGLLAVGAFIRVPVGPVPLTLQTAAAVLAGFSIGPLWGAAACLLYMSLGLTGLPIFASGGGPAYVFTPTFGYIIGFAVGAATTGLLAAIIRPRGFFTTYVCMLGGLVDIYIIGLIWLSFSLHWFTESPQSLESLIRMGVFIPLPGDLITLIPAAAVGLKIRRLLNGWDENTTRPPHGMG